MSGLNRAVGLWVVLSFTPNVFAQNGVDNAQPAASVALGKVESDRTKVKEISDAWSKHRNQRIAVLNIKGLDDSAPGGDEKTLLESRLETLQRKKISNREWASYWQAEADFAARLITAYRVLVPVAKSPDSQGATSAAPRPLVTASARLKRTADTEFVQKIADAQTAQEEAARTLKSAEQVLTERQVQIVAELSKVTRSLEALSGRLERVSKSVSSASAAEKGPLSDELSKAQREHAASQATLERLRRENEEIDGLLSGQDAGFQMGAESIQAEVKAYLQAKKRFKSADARLAQLTEESNGLRILALRLRDEDRLYRGRIQALTAWGALAQKKVKNQAIYYEAIEADIDAVNQRLRSFKEAPSEEVVYSEDVCGRPLGSDETPFAHHRACVTAIKVEIDRLRDEREQVLHKKELTAKLKSSIKALTSAQTTDEELVREEAAISSAELSRASALVGDARREDEEWTELWSTYSQRAQSKVTSLSDAVLTSKTSRRMLDAKAGVIEDALKRLDGQLEEVQAKLAETDNFGAAAVSLLATSLQLVKVGWPALIYLFLAWMLLRFIRRYRDRQEEKAIRAQEGEGNEELEALNSKLAQAKRAEDDAAESALHEEIGQLQSRIKDENQRIATIARVAAQALSLIIYVATFLLVLDALTVDIGPILGGAAIFGLAISFGSQSLVKDVVSGFFILLENQYAVGDVVSINGKSGTVEMITLRRTVLRDMSGGVHNITNGSISSVINSTQGWSRVVINIGVAYGTDISLVEEVINREGEAMYDDPDWSSKLTEKPVFVGVVGFGENDITVRTWFKTKTFQNWGAEREFNLRIKRAFEEAGIEIPFPQRTIHVINGQVVPPELT